MTNIDDLNVTTGVRTVTVDNGDGTGTRTVYLPDGSVDTVEQLAGLPLYEPPEPTDAERIAQLEAIIDALIGGN